MRILTALVLAAACGASVPALAQQDSPPPDAATTSTATETAIEAILPEACRSEHTMSMPSTPPMADMPGVGPAQQALIASMANSAPAMMVGMMAADPDVAFVCGMIAHHQAAIDMAKAEIAHGTNDWAKQKAQAIIDAQQAEIVEMTDWLGKTVAVQ